MSAAADYVTALLEGLGSSPSPQTVVEALVPEVADLVQLFVRVDNELRLIAFRHLDPDYHPVLEELAKIHRPSLDHPSDPVAHVVRTGEARWSQWIRRADVERVTADTRVHAMFDVLQPRGIVVVPLRRDGACYGALVVVLSSSGRRFIEGDLDFIAGLAARIAPLIDVP